MPTVDIDGLLAHIRNGSRGHIARAITLVESTHPDHRAAARELIASLGPYVGAAHRVGITGIPGAGKSTFIDALGTRLIGRGSRVGVLAVDPSSTRTGGSILGDRTRMAGLAASDHAYVRPSPSGGHLGGVARATREASLILEAAGHDVIIIETVGVGQSEVAVAGMVDTFLLLALARSGDQLQGIKRGILELADVIAVNKADGDNVVAASTGARELAGAMRLMNSDGGRVPPVLTCSAHTGDGLEAVWEAVCSHRKSLEADGHLAARRRAQQVQWLWTLVEADLSTRLHSAPRVLALRDGLERSVADGTVSAVDAADAILGAFLSSEGEGGAPEGAGRHDDGRVLRPGPPPTGTVGHGACGP